MVYRAVVVVGHDLWNSYYIILCVFNSRIPDKNVFGGYKNTRHFKTKAKPSLLFRKQ